MSYQHRVVAGRLRVDDAGAAWADELAPYRYNWPAEFVPFQEYVSDVLGHPPIDVADVVADLEALPHGWRIIAPGSAETGS